METAAPDILKAPAPVEDRPLCDRCGLPLLPVRYGWLTLWQHGDPDECERTYEAEQCAFIERRRGER